MQRRRLWDICSYETNVPVEFPVMHLSSSGNHLDHWSVIYFRSEPFPSASQVKYFPPNVNMLPTAISICHIRITCTGEWVTLMFTHAASVCVCSIAEGCTLKLVLAMRGGPINTRRGKEEIRELYYTHMVDVFSYRSAVQCSLKTCCSKGANWLFCGIATCSLWEKLNQTKLHLTPGLHRYWAIHLQ